VEISTVSHKLATTYAIRVTTKLSAKLICRTTRALKAICERKLLHALQNNTESIYLLAAEADSVAQWSASRLMDKEVND